MTDRDPRIITLRALDCPDRINCPSKHRFAGHAGIYTIGKQVTDPDVIAAFAPLLGDDELLSWTPDELHPEVAP